MSVPLSPEQASALAAQPGEPLEVIDDHSHARYVLLPAEQFERIKALVGADDFDIKESYAAQEQVLKKAGWDDPELDVYNDYDAHRS
jgi:hypothetical protein